MTSLVCFLSSPLLVLPVVIFLAELCVVTISTMRIIFISRGMKVLASLLGFFEVAIWLFAIGQTMQNLSNIACFAAFAGGFTVGNYLGILLEERLAMGTVLVRIITSKDAGELIEDLRAAEYGVTRIDGQGATGPVQIVFTVIRRKALDEVIGIIKRFDPRAFYSVDELQSAAAGIFPLTRPRFGAAVAGPLRLLRLSARRPPVDSPLPELASDGQPG